MATNPLDNKQQAWSALFSEPMSELVKRYTASVFFDKRLWQADIEGSLAHAEMLCAQGVIGAQDLADIQRGMAQIRQEIESGALEWKLELEDVHLNIEARLTQLVGDAGKRLHTGRSRNDQVATDLRLWTRREARAVARRIHALQEVLVVRAEGAGDTYLPGYTHLQRAQPVLLAHHLLAHVWSLGRDVDRFLDAADRADVSPLGAGALAGSSLPLDPDATAAALGFSEC